MFCGVPVLLFLFLVDGGSGQGLTQIGPMTSIDEPSSRMHLRRPDVCLLFADPGSGSELEWKTRYWYNMASDSCIAFTFGGHRGNYNNFVSPDICQWFCLAGHGELSTYPLPDFAPDASRTGDATRRPVEGKLPHGERLMRNVERSADSPGDMNIRMPGGGGGMRGLYDSADGPKQ